MLRAVLEPVALFLSPFVAFAIYLALRARYPLAVEHWTRGRVSTLTLVGLFVAVARHVRLRPHRAARPRRLRARAYRKRRS